MWYLPSRSRVLQAFFRRQGAFLGLVALAWLCASCVSAPAGPAVALAPELDGIWVYQGGEPPDDPLLPWSRWPDLRLTIDAARGEWRAFPRPGALRTVLPAVSQVVAVEDNVLTLAPTQGGRKFQVYWRIVDGRLNYWYGDHADWLKPYVVFGRD